MPNTLLLFLSTSMLICAQTLPAWKEFSIGPPTKNQSRIGPQGITAQGIPLQRVIARAYGLPEYLISGPGWIVDDRYAMTALVDTPQDFRPLLQQELAKRFHLEAHREMRDLPVFLLQQIDGVANKLSSNSGGRGANLTTGNFRFPNATLAQLCAQLGDFVGKPVIDESGIAGRYDIELTWSGGDLGLMDAVKNQLGLKLIAAQRSVEVLVVDHVEKLTFPAAGAPAAAAPAAAAPAAAAPVPAKPVPAGSAAAGQDIAGDWRGSLNAQGAQYRLVLHFAKGADGSWLGTVDNLDRKGGMGQPYTAVSFDGSTVKLVQVRNGLAGRYEGKLESPGTIRGTWSQTGLSVPVVLTRDTTANTAPPKPEAFVGAWQGDLNLGLAALWLVVHIENGPNGAKATMNSPDQDAYGLRATAAKIDGAFFRVEWKAIDAVYEGRMNSDRSAIEGVFTQSGLETSLTLKPAKEADLERKRLQTPVKPYPYREERVRYSNPDARIQLAGTLTIPQGKGPFPAAMLVAGSGPLDRDEVVGGHRVFLVLADYLTRHGIVVLRADKRGIGESKGDFATALTADFASDAEAGLAYLRTRKEVDAAKVGIVGHSEGGIIAPMVAAKPDQNVAFVAIMAGPGLPGVDFAAEQARTTAEALGVPTLPAVGAMQPGPWLKALLVLDPADLLRKVTCPVLAINGSKDKQVLAGSNLPAIRAALEAGGNRHFEVVEFPGLNHLFQTADTGWPIEYGHIEETIAPAVLEKISSWISGLR